MNGRSTANAAFSDNILACVDGAAWRCHKQQNFVIGGVSDNAKYILPGERDAILEARVTRAYVAIRYCSWNGRNARHTTWTQRSASPSWTFEHARRRAEAWRRRGDVFYIEPMPVLVFEAWPFVMVVIDENTEAPFVDFHPLQEFATRGDGSIDRSSCIRPYDTLMAVAKRFSSNRGHWSTRRLAADTCIQIGEHPATYEVPFEIERDLPDGFIRFKPFSNGAAKGLSWTASKTNLDPGPIQRLASSLNVLLDTCNIPFERRLTSPMQLVIHRGNSSGTATVRYFMDKIPMHNWIIYARSQKKRLVSTGYELHSLTEVPEGASVEIEAWR